MTDALDTEAIHKAIMARYGRAFYSDHSYDDAWASARDVPGLVARVAELEAARSRILALCDVIEIQHGGVPSTFVVEIRAAYGLPNPGGYPEMRT